MGYKFKEMGFRVVNLKLTFTLLGLSVPLGIYAGVFKFFDYKLLLYRTIEYVFGTFINGLPEELFFRGFLLSRLEAVLKNSLNALVISAIVFSLTHIPSMVITYNNNILYALFRSFSLFHGLAGLILGYLYLRTRSIVPVMLWHAIDGRLGTMFFWI
ncbi:MAG: CPBP family intramembrane metalloprotease [Thermosediminibacteraceae bacterium]|nr:CPBP family intramembrane metalloprotease [Thermosediminibacteraceae bacterium]